MSEPNLEAELAVETKAARKAAAHSIKWKCTSLVVPCPSWSAGQLSGMNHGLGMTVQQELRGKRSGMSETGKAMKYYLQDLDRL